MSVNFSNHLKNAMLNQATGNTDWNTDNTRYIWLFNDVDGNLEFQLTQGSTYLQAEITASDYDPIPVVFNGSGSNVAVSFPTAQNTWGRVTHLAVFGHYNTHCFFWKKLDSPIYIFTGDTLSFPTGYLQASIT